jgi:methionine sulfoxide reductase catalytic subunit
MLIKSKADLTDNDVTPKEVYLRRREIMAMGLGAGLALGVGASSQVQSAQLTGKLRSTKTFWTKEDKTPYEAVTTYNNFYEFGTDKSEPARHAAKLTTRPWSIRLTGQCHKPQTIDIYDILKGTLEERIYRLRCVEGWSMVIPWVGIPLASLIKRADPNLNAKYVAFETVARKDEMRGVNSGVLEWPYREGLRLDEALNPLTFLAVGLYGELLPNQNGAPIRLVVPWKYGFKSIKSIIKISFVESEPPTAWNLSQPSEYGFYSNVNPNVDHPRWSQATERRIGEFKRRDTLMFNGYGEHVAHLYKGMDLKKFY